MRKRVTLKDIAREAGVHVSTVSRALDPGSKTSLTDDVEKKIRKIATRLGYRPNRIAAGLRTNRSMSIGLIIPDITNTLFPPLVRGVESVLEPAGYTTILVNTDNNLDRERRQIEVLREHGVDGIISGAAELKDPGLAEAAAQGLPVVTVNRRLEKSPVPYVINDESDGFRMLVEHLVHLGHQHLAYISGPLELSTGVGRYRALKENCAILNLKLDDDVIEVASRYDEAEGQRCAKALLARKPQTTAILCANDRLAIGAYAGLGELNLRVPKDVSVTGFNDNPMLGLIPPGLTTIRVEQFEAGRACAEILLTAIRGDRQGSVGTVLPVEMIVRQSTAPPRPTAE